MSSKGYHNHKFELFAYKITKKEWINNLYSLILHLKLLKNGKKTGIFDSYGMFFAL